MSAKLSFALKAVAIAVGAFAVAAVFSAYLRPAMLIEFANLVLCT